MWVKATHSSPRRWSRVVSSLADNGLTLGWIKAMEMPPAE
jgi:hypothetical protein